MGDDWTADAPEELPEYVVDAVSRQPPEKLQLVAEWAATLAERKRGVGGPDIERQEEIAQRVMASGCSASTNAYPEVPDRAYLTIKEPRPGYEYAYWQWRSSPDVDAPDRNYSICSLTDE